MMLERKTKKANHPAKFNTRTILSAARGSGLTTLEIRKLLAGGKLGRSIPDSQISDITKGVKLARWGTLTKSITQCDKKLAIKNLPDDIWVAVNKAKVEFLAELAVLTKELDEIGKLAASRQLGQPSPHSFGPREQIGNVTAVQVNIGKAPEQSAVTDVSNISSIRT